jgi:cysteate synthase
MIRSPAAKRDRQADWTHWNKSPMHQHYTMKCQSCDTTFEDDGFMLECPVQHPETALLTTHYTATNFEPDSRGDGIFRYHRWLPIDHLLYGAGKTITYQSQKLCDLLGLPNLWIAFNGYWSDRGAKLETTTFKELEAYAVLSRLPTHHDKVLVVASAGNTAAAFAYVCSQSRIPCLLVVPESGLTRLRLSVSLAPCVKVISLLEASYDDAIRLANQIAQLDRFFLEGGVKNIGRRDGIGTTLLDAVETIGQLPDYYFQAIGSGAGAIAVHEAAKRLIVAGQFGHKLPRLMLSQNFPFMPIYSAWKAHQRQLLQDDCSQHHVTQIVASVLSNQRPPYAIKGGVYDALVESQGDMFFADNQEVRAAIALFQDMEGVEIEPAAGVTFASLIKAVQQDRIERDAFTLLHITGGRCREYLNRTHYPAEPTIHLSPSEFSSKTPLDQLATLIAPHY